ncbi:hypothetical protein WICPIJ_007665 [Wickerhamomyces pijperi]|uniref:Uncharacterized protein n=1 Tax=Wickerhamomyces pijperi TaxID=599730 RepID=A0A9P8TK87_WICPI|nr:hypothetical protein WICPIJ_007665 [Wickerhamomyces pijperi]
MNWPEGKPWEAACCCNLNWFLAWICCSNWDLLTSFLWAKATYNGLPATMCWFISEMALAASSGEEKETKPKPLDLPDSSTMTLTEAMVPKAENSSFNFSSSMESSKFLMNKLTAWTWLLSNLLASNCFFKSSKRSAFFWARPTYNGLPFHSLPFKFSMALTADSCCSWITLRPHDSDGTALDFGVVQFCKSLFTIGLVLVVNVGVTKGSLGDGITTDSDGGNGTDLREDVE